MRFPAVGLPPSADCLPRAAPCRMSPCFRCDQLHPVAWATLLPPEGCPLFCALPFLASGLPSAPTRSVSKGLLPSLTLRVGMSVTTSWYVCDHVADSSALLVLGGRAARLSLTT